MSKKFDGFSAFPCPHGCEANKETSGMTLRDYFAAAALQGIASIGYWPKKDDYPLIASHAYGLADAMLAERAK